MKKTERKVIISVVTASALASVFIVVSAILYNIMLDYPEINPNKIYLLITLPSLLAMIIAFIAGPVSLKVNKKLLQIIGICCILAGGFLNLLLGLNGIGILYTAAVLIGIGQGILMSIGPVIIAEAVSPEKQGMTFGLNTAFTNLGMGFCTFAGGYLAAYGWQKSYLTFLIAVPILIITVVCLPWKLEKAEPAEDFPSAKKDKEETQKLPLKVVFMTIHMVLFVCFSYVFFLYISEYIIADLGIGDTASAGTTNTLYTVFGIVAGLIFGLLQKKLKKWLIPVVCLVAAVGNFMFAYATGAMTGFYFASALLGFAVCAYTPAAMSEVTSLTPAKISAIVLSVFMGLYNFGMYIPANVMQGLSVIFGDSMQTKFVIAAVVSVILAVSAVPLYVMQKKERQ